ncbi:hypothetical protein GCM10011585_11880 [Edaphobacter dinghuensis]|uniref:Uncharacterized protein n=1 Tax=Edaphobacter dinghuensis TaxID=1560005 RepID=A0A917H8W0_9BACT|nr:hypothetical protein GCM10011585_11880 [Edaphobacter dinghuensis]
MDGVCVFGHLGDGREIAVARVDEDLFDGRLVVGFGFGFVGFGQVVADDLEAVEEKASLFHREVVAGYALQDFGDGGEDGAAVFERGQLELGPGAAVASFVGGAEGGVMVVAEVFAAERGAAATVAVDEDVAAAVAFGWILRGLDGGVDGLVCHGVPPPILKS